MLLPEKIRNLRFSNCCKCTEIINPTITNVVLYRLKSFTIPSGGPFLLLGGGMRAPSPVPTGVASR